MDNFSIFRFIFLLCIYIFPAISNSATYYLDDTGGNDLNDGLTQGTAWQSLDKISTTTFSPGDRILLKGGGVWVGEMDLNGNGTADDPIVVDRYGSGLKPVINGGGYESAVRLAAVSYWEINRLRITNNGGPTLSGSNDYRVGVLVKTNWNGIRRHIHLKDLIIYDIFPETGPYGHGIHFNASGSSTADTYFDDIMVADCDISVTGRYGVWCQHKGSSNSNPGFKYNTNIVIRNNLFTNCGGSGVQTGWGDGILLEGNITDTSGASVDPRQWARGSGYWPWKSRNVLVQFNEFKHARGHADSCGVHVDFGCRDVTIQYNLSLDNEGGFVEILGDCINATYRYNVSINDAHRIDGVNGGTQDGHLFWVSNYNGASNPTIGSINSQIYNNTIYVRPGTTPYIKIMNKSTDTYIRNNIIYSDGNIVYTDSGTNTVFDNNLWHGNLPASVPFGSNAVFTDPLLINASGERTDDYLLTYNTPAIAKGVVIPANGGVDFWQNPLPATVPTIGAHEAGNGNPFYMTPIDDSYVRFPSPDTNYGTNVDIAMRDNSNPMEGYMKFNVSSVTESVKSAKLFLYSRDANHDISLNEVSDNSWDELSITWNNKPAMGNTVTTGAGLLDEWLEFDVSDYISGNGTYSFGLLTDSSSRVDIGSKESNTVPYLCITTGPLSSVEMECEITSNQLLFAPLLVQNDPGASGGQYIVNPSTGEFNSAPDDQDPAQAVFGFKLTQASDVIFNLLADFPSSNDDSFYYKLNDGSWQLQDSTQTTGWEMLQITTFAGLQAGDHTLTILQREDGARLDKIVLSAYAGEISAIIFPPPTQPQPSASNHWMLY